MYVKAIHYKDVWLAPGSQAFELYQSLPKTQKELDNLVKECNDCKNKMEGRK